MMVLKLIDGKKDDECEEVFITGTSKHVAPVVEVEGRVIGNGKPGKMTKAISEAYERFFGLL